MARNIMIAAALIATGCGRSPKGSQNMPVASGSPLAAEAVAGVTDAHLRDLLADHWEWSMRWSPTAATRLGDHRYDDQLPKRSKQFLEQYKRERAGLLERARAIAPSGLAAADRVTLALFEGELAADVAAEVCHDEQWSVSASSNPYAALADVVELHPLKTADDGRNLVARLRQGPVFVADTIANLREGVASQRVASAEAVRRTIAQLDAELAKPTAAWAMNLPGAAPRPDWPDGAQARFAAELAATVDALRPSIVDLRDFLRDEVLPVARTGKREGIGALADGDACYRARILGHLGFERTPEELHQLGIAEIARIDRELAALGQKVLGTKDLAATIERLRTDKALYFDTPEALLAAAQDALDRARAAIPAYFGVLPRADCVIAVIPEHEAPYTTIAYYEAPHHDGSKPGEYFVNTYRPETRPRFEIEALSWHEAIPGHHLQIAIAQELGDVPSFRKHGGSTAYVEGWALYTERLAEEMGLYSSDLDRIGMLSYDAWRASRLVVDTGLHAKGWTRAEAEAYMLAHTALTPENISNEVDRYIGWPGQALAYKVGQLEILALREQARTALGAGFDLKRFHDVVLSQGAVTLPVLRAQVEAWIAETAGR
ncbi:MAG TPA: DUF885 domain-containing protein [Kofleriaceae bacterium]|nr:DUF885 domain-containing protein [Kofleriaceae bacterium]